MKTFFANKRKSFLTILGTLFVLLISIPLIFGLYDTKINIVNYLPFTIPFLFPFIGMAKVDVRARQFAVFACIGNDVDGQTITTISLGTAIQGASGPANFADGAVAYKYLGQCRDKEVVVNGTAFDEILQGGQNQPVGNQAKYEITVLEFSNAFYTLMDTTLDIYTNFVDILLIPLTATTADKGYRLKCVGAKYEPNVVGGADKSNSFKVSGSRNCYKLSEVLDLNVTLSA